MDTVLVFIGLSVGSIFGFLIASTLISGKMQDEYRAGYLRGKNDSN